MIKGFHVPGYEGSVFILMLWILGDEW